MLFKNAFVFTGDAFEALDVAAENGVITAVGALDGPGEDCTGRYLLPGLVDLHTHGCGGRDFDTAGPDQMREMEKTYARHGTAAVLATLMTGPEDAMRAAARRCGAACGGVIKGIYLEGPFLSPAKKGAHRADCLRSPDGAFFDELCALSGGKVRLITVDPCAEGALAFIRHAAKTCRVALGHTPADYETAQAGFAAGASQVTHLFNAMAPLHHREPGLAGAALAGDCFAELICDGIHLHPAVLKLSFAALGARAVVISDSMAACGLADGQYSLGGQEVTVRGRRATLSDGTLAGSVTFAFDGMRQLIRAGVPAAEAVRAATLTPAKAAGLEGVCGVIAPGRQADLLLCGGEWDLQAVWLAGEQLR